MKNFKVKVDNKTLLHIEKDDLGDDINVNFHSKDIAAAAMAIIWELQNCIDKIDEKIEERKEKNETNHY